MIRRRTPWVEILCAAGALALIVFIFWAFWADSKAREECRRRGGHVEEYDCRDVTSCHTYSDGHGGYYTSCSTRRECSWRCAGLPAEDPRPH